MTASRLAWALAVAVLAMAWPHGIVAQRPTATTPGSAALTVVVTTAEPSGRPLRRATVSLQAGELGVPRTAVTDDEGRVAFDRLPAGNYVVSAAKPGYVRTFYGSRVPGMGPGVAVALVEGQRLDIRAEVLRGGVIGGVLRTPGGRPAANLTVQAVDRKRSLNRQESMFGDSPPGVVQTDDRGMYRIFGLAPGDYVVSARSPSREEVRAVTAAELQWADKIASGAASPGGAAPVAAGAPAAGPSSALAPVYYPGTAIAADAATITLSPGEERLGVDFALVLVPTAQVRGRLMDAEGRPQPNMSVTARPVRPPGSDMLQMLESAFGSSTRTSGDGSFAMTGLRPGRYTLEVRATPRTANEPPTAPAFGTHWVKDEISVAGVDITDVTLVLKPGLTFSGRVVYEGTTLAPPANLAALSFRLVPASTDTGGPAAMAMAMVAEARIGVAADGTFSAAGIAPGLYRFVAQPGILGALSPSVVASAGGWVVKSAMAGGRDIADAVLEVRAGENVSGVVVTFTDQPTELSGRVFDRAGRVTADFPIVIVSTDRTTWVRDSRRVQVVRPATDGRFVATGLPAGEYYLAAVTAIEPDQLADPSFLEQLAAVAIKLAIADGEKKTQDVKLAGG
jgi:hypothetical protein